MAVVRFPTDRRFLGRKALGYADRLGVIDTEIREIDAALTALKERRSAAVKEYRAELRDGAAERAAPKNRY